MTATLRHARTAQGPTGRQIVLLLLLAAAAGWGVEFLLAIVNVLGQSISPVHDLARDYVTAAVLSLVLGLSILLWPLNFRERLVAMGLWAAKVAVALGFMLLYEAHYTSLDAMGYFAASMAPAADWSAVHLGAGTQNVGALSWLFARLVPSSYHALKIACAMVGLIAIVVYYRAAVAASGKTRLALFVGLGLTPSVLFWSSILGKDPITLLGTALYCYGVVRWTRERRLLPLVWAVLGIGIATFIRLWMAPIMIVPIVLLWFMRLRTLGARILLIGVAAMGLTLGLSVMRRQLLGETVTDIVSETNSVSQGWSEGGSAEALSQQFTGIPSMIRFLPLGMFTALFRPLPGEVNNAFGALAGLEDAALLGLALVAVARTKREDLLEPLVAGALCFILVWAVVYSFISFQNLGTAVRFRLQIMPPLVLLLLYLARKRSPIDLSMEQAPGAVQT